MLHPAHQEMYDRRDAARKAKHEGKKLTMGQLLDLGVLDGEHRIIPENPEDLEREHWYYKNKKDVPAA